MLYIINYIIYIITMYIKQYKKLNFCVLYLINICTFNVCINAIWLDKGKIIMEGSSSQVCQAYENHGKK